MLGYAVESATKDARQAAAALRRAVFVDEMGARAEIEDDRFDAIAEHLVVRAGDRVVGTLRLATGAAYTGREFDLSPLRTDPRDIAEIGRMCLHPAHRGGAAGAALLIGAVERLRSRGVGLIVGTASFLGTDADRHMPALRALRDAALAPSAMRPRAYGAEAVAVEGRGDARDMRGVPTLIKTYLRAGAWVGEGAWRDDGFNCIDVCMVMDLARLRLPDAVRREARA